MLKGIVILGILAFILLGVVLTSVLEKKKWLPNRWVTGSAVFLISFIPSMLLPQLPQGIKGILYGLSALCAVIFFETTRRLLERNEYKGIVSSQAKRK